MNNIKTFTLLLILVIFLFSCKEKSSSEQTDVPKQDEAPAQSEEEKGWEDILPSVVRIDSYDGDRILESGQGFFVGEDLMVTKYSLVSQATKVFVTPFGSNTKYIADKYIGVDRINDIVLLKVDSFKCNRPIELFSGNAPETAKTMYISSSSDKTIQLFTGKLLNLTTTRGVRLYRITNNIRTSMFGTPIFVSNKKAIGIAFSAIESFKRQGFVIPSGYITDLLSKNGDTKSLETLRSVSNAETAAENMKIKGLVIETDRGDITIKLYNETPEYRDNFIQLAKENYFDSLLIHRVIRDFGIQSGAADTRYAKKGDIVGFKGPGYTIPAHIVPGIFHKRGTIGSPRLPDTENQRRRSDGSQFYIVSGRQYFDMELDDIEEENDYKFSEEQREIYKTIGGAPYLDGTYTVFGEVVSGMNIVDSIVVVETDRQWRPIEDIRVNRITILR